MNDRHKFRVWDLINKRMYNDVHLVDRLNEYLTRPNEYVPLQCLGMNDKNDKPIYEGDIECCEGDEPMIVCYDRGIYGLRYPDDSANPGYVETCIEWANTNIIGNIHQHPELLEVTA